MRIRERIIIVLFVMMLAACGADQTARGNVTLRSPLDTTIVYASALSISGTAADIEGGLLVRVSTVDGETLAETILMQPQATWRTELLHGYSGDPQNVIVRVYPLQSAVEMATQSATQSADGSEMLPYASAEVILSGLEHRPEGVFGDVLSPEIGSEVGGDQIQVRGRVSGIEEGFTVLLINSDGATIDSQTVTLASPYAIDDQPWAVDLMLNGYTGSAIISVNFTEDLTITIPVILSSAAG